MGLDKVIHDELKKYENLGLLKKPYDIEITFEKDKMLVKVTEKIQVDKIVVNVCCEDLK